MGEFGLKGFTRQRGTSWDLKVFLGRDPLAAEKRYVTQTEHCLDGLLGGLL